MNYKEQFRQINILYYALLAGQALFCLVILFGVLDPESRQSGWPDQPLGLILPVFFAGVFSAAYLISQKGLAGGAGEPDLEAKLGHYRTVVIRRAALLEGFNLFCLVALLLENNTTYLLIFGAGLLVFLNYRPSVNEFFQHYQLKRLEKEQFLR